MPSTLGLAELADRATERLAAAGIAVGSVPLDTLARLAIASDFAIDTLARQPGLWARLQAGARDAPPPPVLDAANRAEWPMLLRRHRQAESTRLVWRDVVEGADVEEILAGSTRLAERCLALAVAALEDEFAQRHGVVRDRDGGAQRLVVFGLGKLGGGELNFSSDIDLVYAYPREGVSDGARPLEAEEYFGRLGRQLAKLLDEVTADGFCHRVDLRLRPYGNAGRMAWSFDALEQYFQREGRDWERYAWQKARPVAGEMAAGDRFLDALRPFVYRRYLDFGALAGLREMKALIDAEVARQDLAADIKRGPGGIREIEFLAQALQLIRGGREPALQERRLLPALQALVAAGQVDPGVGAMLAGAYRYLRRLENRLQMLQDAQVHALPEDARSRQRLAAGLGHADWDGLHAECEAWRARVAAEFAALLASRAAAPAVAMPLADYWRALPDAGDAAVLAAHGFSQPAALDGSLRDFKRAPGVRELGDGGRARLDRLLPALLNASAVSVQPDAALARAIDLLQNILRRGNYLALLDEQPRALARLVDALGRSALLAERVARHPLLLDELLDHRLRAAMPDADALRRACAAAVAGQDDDTGAALHALNEARQSLGFRIALATLDRRQSARDSARQLADLADAVLGEVLRLAWRELRMAHGEVAGARFAILGYGSLGGRELAFGSDLDLVFLYDAPAGAESEGPRPLEASRWFARLAQKIVSLLQTPTAGGTLYDVDVRLRPDGAKGLLVSTLHSYAAYQRERAWTWEHQALVRARCVAGDLGLCADFERLRDDVLARPRDPAALRDDVAAMRRRMRGELDRGDARRFDLKHGAGALVDLEFLLQYLVLRDAARRPALLGPRDTPGLIDALHASGRVAGADANALHAAHEALLDAALACTLDRKPRLAPADATNAAARSAISNAIAVQGLDFGETSPKDG